MQRFFLMIVLCLVGQIAIAEGEGVVKTSSDFPVAQTVQNITAILTQKKFKIFGTIDHQKNAQKNGLKLTPNTVIIFGNPNVGTPLMQSSASIGLDLPVKFHIYQENNRTYVSYNDPSFLAKRHGIPNTKPQIQKMAAALKKIVTKATKKSA